MLLMLLQWLETLCDAAMDLDERPFKRRRIKYLLDTASDETLTEAEHSL
jgi:hypothetical protein